MNFYKTLTIFSIILLLQLTNVTICNGQDNFWERFLNIFQKEEPYARVRGDDRIELGDTTEIRWDIKNADKIHIKGIKQDIPSKGSIKLQPDSTRFYKFLMYQDDEVHRKFFKVEVYKPRVKYFNMPEKVTDEEEIRISWKVTGARTVSIPGIADSLDPRGSLHTRLEDSVLTIVGKGKYNTVKEKAHVNLNYVEYLKGTEKIYKDQEATIKWKFKNSKYVTVKGKERKFDCVDSLKEKPVKDKNYELLIHRNSGDTDTMKHNLKVSPPQIHHFRGPEYAKKEQKFSISWSTASADTVWLGKKEVASDGYTRFKITQDTTFTLTMRNDEKFYRKNLEIKALPPRAYVSNIDTNKRYKKDGLDIDIISLDQSGFPDQIKLRVVVVDTIGNFIHSLAPPYIPKDRKRLFFRSLVEKVNKKRHTHNFNVREIRVDTAKAYNVSMVLDHSLSMLPLIDTLQNSARGFINAKFRSDQISIIKFDHLISKMNELEKDKQTILDSANFKGLKNFGGATALYAAMDEGVRNLNKELPNKTVVLFTDGYENASFLYFGMRAFKAKQIARKIHNKDIMLFIVSYGDAVNKKVLDKLAMLSGGKHYQLRKEDNIQKVFEELPRIFRYYYEITFNPMTDDGTHNLTLSFDNRQGSIVRAKKSFYVGSDYEFIDNLLIPLYLLTEIPVRNDIVVNPQIMANFDFDKHNLKMKYYPVVNKYVEYMIKHPKTKILLAGHTDSKGSKEYCRKLSKKRALEVKEYIMESGIDESRIETKGFGKKHLKWDPDEEDQKARENRRVEALLYRH